MERDPFRLAVGAMVAVQELHLVLVRLLHALLDDAQAVRGQLLDAALDAQALLLFVDNVQVRRAHDLGPVSVLEPELVRVWVTRRELLEVLQNVLPALFLVLHGIVLVEAVVVQAVLR